MMNCIVLASLSAAALAAPADYFKIGGATWSTGKPYCANEVNGSQPCANMIGPEVRCQI
jgi:hypothetical protein